MKKNQILIALMLSVSMIISGCSRLKTPEELIQPPELNVEKKKLNDALLNNLPQNADLIVLPYARGLKEESSLVNRNIDLDSEREAVALYRDKNTRKIGLIVLDKKSEAWYKKADIKLDAFEVSDYKVMDVNNDGMDEIIIGYYGVTNPYKELNIYKQTENGLEIVFKDRYLAMDVLDADNDGTQDIVISDFGNTEKNSRVSILNFSGDDILKISEIVYPKENEVYSINYGKVNDSTKAFFIDMYVNETYGQTDVVVYKDKKLVSLIDESEIGEIVQSTPIKSADIDDDGIVEIAKMQFIDKVDIKNNFENSFIKNYYKITEALTLELATQIYEDFDLGVNVFFPKSYQNNFSLEKEMGKNELMVYFSSTNINEKTPLLEVKKVDKEFIDSYLGEYQMISELENMVVVAKLFSDTPRSLSVSSKEKYEKMVGDSQDLTLIVKLANI